MKSFERLCYLVLGTPGSGQREIVRDLLESGVAQRGQAGVLISAAEGADAADPTVAWQGRWEWLEGAITAEVGPEVGMLFFVADGRLSPVEQLESIKPWLAGQGFELARVLCVVDCRLASAHAALLPWFEACIHFSDVVLLNHREGVSNKWLSDFTAHFKGQFFPCLFELVKDGRVRNPALVLEPQARRVSHYFDPEQEWVFTDADGEEIDEQDESPDGEEGVEAALEVDPYFVRDAAGRRLKRIPDINKFLPPISP